jgi:hypothetical protein
LYQPGIVVLVNSASTATTGTHDQVLLKLSIRPALQVGTAQLDWFVQGSCVNEHMHAQPVVLLNWSAAPVPVQVGGALTAAPATVSVPATDSAPLAVTAPVSVDVPVTATLPVNSAGPPTTVTPAATAMVEMLLPLLVFAAAGGLHVFSMFT